jgi:hypothetical protein
MATILCAYSGLEFKVEHFPLTLSSREMAHPIFYIPQKKLLGFTSKWAAGELTETDSYLLFLALLHSTDKVEFRVPAFRTTFTSSIVANNMERLLSTVGRINCIKHPGFNLPQFVISPDTKDLANISNWIHAWEECIQDFHDGYRTYNIERALINRETALEKLIKNPSKSIASYANILADWAEVAGNFPTFLTTLETGESIPFNRYWKSIIVKCVKDEAIFAIPRADLDELIEYCETEITHGSIFSHSLMSLLKSGLKKQINYLGLGDITLSDSPYKIVNSDSDVEAANLLIMIESAPDTFPVLSGYPSKLAYLRAKMKWEMRIEYQKAQEQKNSEIKGDSDGPDL